LQSYRIVDSIPIPVCKFGRAHFHKTLRGFGAAYGKYASKKETHLGYKLHMLTTLNGLIYNRFCSYSCQYRCDGIWDLLDPFYQIALIRDKELKNWYLVN